MNWTKDMRKRFLAALFAAAFLFGMPASAEYFFQTPILATHPLQLDYIGTGQCIVTNPGYYAVQTNLTIINTETETPVAYDSFVVPPYGQKVLSYQSFSSIKQNHICTATMGFKGLNNSTEPNWLCDETSSLIIRSGFQGGMPEVLVKFQDNDFTSNPDHQNAVVRMINKGVCAYAIPD